MTDRADPRPSGRDEHGLTLIEVLIASALTVTLLTMAFTILHATTKTALAITNRAVNVANARIALDSVEASLRYAEGAWVVPGTTTSTLYAESTASIYTKWTITTGTTPATELLQRAVGTSSQICAATPATIMPGVTAGLNSAGGTTGFYTSSSLPDLVETDLVVNEEAGFQATNGSTSSSGTKPC
jgi:Tfp pilus assembly protein PilW